jgi:hypothetical protein
VSGLDIRRRGSRDHGRPAGAISMPAAARDSMGLARMGRDRMRLAPTARFRIVAPAASARSGLARAAVRVAPTPALHVPAAPVMAPRDRAASDPGHVPAASDQTVLAPTVHDRADRARAATDRDPPASVAALAPAASAPMRPDPTSTPERIATAPPPRPPGVSGSPAGSGRPSRPDRPVVGSVVSGRSRRGPASRRAPASRLDRRPAT